MKKVSKKPGIFYFLRSIFFSSDAENTCDYFWSVFSTIFAMILFMPLAIISIILKLFNVSKFTAEAEELENGVWAFSVIGIIFLFSFFLGEEFPSSTQEFILFFSYPSIYLLLVGMVIFLILGLGRLGKISLTFLKESKRIQPFIVWIKKIKEKNCKKIDWED